MMLWKKWKYRVRVFPGVLRGEWEPGGGKPSPYTAHDQITTEGQATRLPQHHPVAPRATPHLRREVFVLWLAPSQTCFGLPS